MRQEAPENLDVPLKGLKAQTYWLVDPGLWRRVGILRDTKDIQRKTKLHGTRKKGQRDSHHCFFVRCPSRAVYK